MLQLSFSEEIAKSWALESGLKETQFVPGGVGNGLPVHREV